jgi:hypothetical protein
LSLDEAWRMTLFCFFRNHIKTSQKKSIQFVQHFIVSIVDIRHNIVYNMLTELNQGNKKPSPIRIFVLRAYGQYFVG